MEKMKIKERVNWPVTILLLLGLITVAFPLYMTIVIALKKPSEMTNSISGILSLPSHLSLDNFAEGNESDRFLAFSRKQCIYYTCNSCPFNSDSFTVGVCNRKK